VANCALELTTEDKGNSQTSNPPSTRLTSSVEQLRSGTIKVKERLGPNAPVTEKEIQDALWHYYYDISQSVTFLKGWCSERNQISRIGTNMSQGKIQAAEAQQRKQMQQARFDQAQAKAATQTTPKKPDGKHIFQYPATPHTDGNMQRLYSGHPWATYCDLDVLDLVGTPTSFESTRSHTPCLLDQFGTERYFSNYMKNTVTANQDDFFWDVPWAAVPKERLTNIILVSTRPKGRLLGGAPKSSKLAALAAARKKRPEEKRATIPSDEGADRAVSLLGRLGAKKENVTPGSPPQAAPPTSPPPIAKPVFPLRPKSNEVETASKEQEPSPTKEEEPALPKVPITPAQVPRASPSTFAQAIFGHEQRQQEGVAILEAQLPSPSPQNRDSMFTLPYASNPEYSTRNPFAGPSPDDVVLGAQSKGSLPGLKQVTGSN
jgi:elongation factor 1 alpha-like protein